MCRGFSRFVAKEYLPPPPLTPASQTPDTVLTTRTYTRADAHFSPVEEHTADEGLYAWGSNSKGQCGPPSSERNFVELKRGAKLKGIDPIIHADLVDEVTLVVTRKGKVFVMGR